MISLEKKFLFVHIPKTGGNSIQTILAQHSEDERVTHRSGQDGIDRFGLKSSLSPALKKHSSLREYKAVLDSALYERLFKFTVVRNPWERAVSFYFSPHRKQHTWNKKLFKQAIDELAPISHYTSLADTQPGDQLDFVIRYESLYEGFEKVCGLLGIDHEPLPHVNQSKRKNYREYYDEELIQLVGNKFAAEIKSFSYAF